LQITEIVALRAHRGDCGVPGLGHQAASTFVGVCGYQVHAGGARACEADAHANIVDAKVCEDPLAKQPDSRGIPIVVTMADPAGT
jgi:hypothetical protein